MISANDKADELKDRCSKMIACSEAPADSESQKKFEENTSLELRNFGQTGNAPSHHGNGAIKLALLIDRCPCELRLLGRKISWVDVTSTLGLAAFAQFLNAIGLGGVS
jgi:hypothetical protein